MENLDEIRERQDKELLSQDNPLQLYPDTLDDLLARNFPPREWLVQGLIPAQAVTIISASPKSYKTWLLLDMAICITQGKKLFGELETKQSNILIVDEESQDYGLYERFKQLQAPQGLPIWWLSRRLHKITDEGYVESIVSRCIALDIKLVMFDSLVRMHSGDENSAKDMSKVMEAFKRLTDYGIAVLIAHHTRKDVPGSYNSETSMRGSSDIFAAIESHIALKRTGTSQYVELKQTKNKFQHEFRAMKLRFVDIDGPSEFQIAEWLDADDDRSVELKKAILLVVGSEPGIYKKLIFDKLVEQKVDIENRKLTGLLKELVGEGKLVTKPGERTKVHYFLADEPSDAEVQ